MIGIAEHINIKMNIEIVLECPRNLFKKYCVKLDQQNLATIGLLPTKV